MIKNNKIGNFNEKYGVMRFTANRGYYTAMKKIVDEYVQELKKTDPETVMMEDIDDDGIKTWIVGNIKNINEMIDDNLRKFGCI